MSVQISFDHRVQSLFPVVLVSILILGSARWILDGLKSENSEIFKTYRHKNREAVFVSDEDSLEQSCNVFEGQWVWDNVSYPLYTEKSCPYLVKQTTCQRNGRPDSYYQNWRWKPSSCDLPRFDALKLLDVLRGKRLMFIGDSVQRGTFESMVCMVQSVIPEGKKSFHRIPPMKIFKAEEYDATIEYYWAPFIVESISDHATKHTVHKRLVNLDAIDKHGKSWEEADILVFESYVWWMYKPQINATYRPKTDEVREYNVTNAYRIALETWAKWLETTIDPMKQRVFFMSMSPTHLWSWEWKPGSDGNCFNELYPINNPSYWGTGSNLEIMEILGDVMQKVRVNVTLLNITQLSEYRKDGHTTVYGERKGKLLTKEQRADPKNFADCIHWCLPGVPDTWNEILYAYLLHSHRNLF
ncbi:PREDICTED: protein trichome birefringence-like 31 [Tarenaya hassleriana]|uniref:protein trichome birefringence-like 31 n=1 Tax=Tarenaya hassleriana TaxID=28532 RepID=UPI00053C67DA|nr:PREDICTED: protein trichome birefringence-like 31 [Tarenaya hassleriana]